MWQEERKTRMELVVSAKKRLRGTPLGAIGGAIGSFDKRARICPQEKGGYFEQS